MDYKKLSLVYLVLTLPHLIIGVLLVGYSLFSPNNLATFQTYLGGVVAIWLPSIYFIVLKVLEIFQKRQFNRLIKLGIILDVLYYFIVAFMFWFATQTIT